MANIGYTQADIDTLRAAIATGATRVRFGAGPDSREVTYRDLAQMKEILGDMIKEVSPSQAGTMRNVGGYDSGLVGPTYFHGNGWCR